MQDVRNSPMRQLFKKRLDFIYYFLLLWWFVSKQRNNVIMNNIEYLYININAW
jgi:hypothetical protein